MKSTQVLFLFSSLLATVALRGLAAEPRWIRFRGPNGCGAIDAATIPTNWSAKDYRWRVSLPGIGYSSPVIWEDRLYITSTIEEEGRLIILCLKTADGSVLWSTSVKCTPHPKYKSNIDASTTPALDKDRLYAAWATPDEHVVIALDRIQGKEIWRRDLGPYVAEDGFGASPVLAGDVLVAANDQDEGGKSSYLGLDRATGQTRWKIDRQSKKASFSTPCLFQPEGGRAQVILTSRAHGITSLDPASGRKNWELPVFDLRATGSPLIVGGVIFASNGAGTSGKYLVAARPGIPEQGVEPKELYRIKDSVPYVPTPVARWPLVFLWSDRGVATCIDGPTGEVHWRQRVGGDYLCSPVCVGQAIYCNAKNGEMVVLAAADKYKLLARVDLGEPTNGTPAVADGVMYLRTLSHVMALGSK
ncbi:MAG: PQQ-binding-like beta-propeller repeat protein [Thermoguttaceae bacterium]